MEQITLPSTVKSIAKYAFFGCEKLTEIIIPPNVTKIEDHSFEGCISLNEISIPSSVKVIGDFAFKGCSLLEELIIPSSVKSIGNGFVSECFSLKNISIPSKIEYFGKLDFHCSLLKEFIIPSSVNKIDDFAFDKCSEIIKVEIPSSVSFIGKYAFRECKSLKKIIIPPLVTSIENNTFDGCYSLSEIIFPSSLKSIGSSSFNRCQSLVNIELPSTVEVIEYDAFKGCDLLEKITIKATRKDFLKKSSLPELKIIPEKITIKILLLGDSDIGKTQLVERYITNNFSEISHATIGPNIKSRNIYINGATVQADICDTPGLERFQSINVLAFRGMNGAIVVFDLSELNSFNHVKHYFSEIYENSKNKVATILLGNKCDLDHSVADKDIKLLEEELNTKYFEVSAKNGTNVDDAFQYICEEASKDILTEKNRIISILSYDYSGDEKKKCSIY